MKRIAMIVVMLAGCQRTLCLLDGGQTLCVDGARCIIGDAWIRTEVCYCVVNAYRSWRFR